MGAGLLCSSSWVHNPPNMCRDEAVSNGGPQLPSPGCKGSPGLLVRLQVDLCMQSWVRGDPRPLQPGSPVDP